MSDYSEFEDDDHPDTTEGDVHKIPVGNEVPRHEDSPDCWCQPTLTYKDPDNGNEVWTHREIQ